MYGIGNWYFLYFAYDVLVLFLPWFRGPYGIAEREPRQHCDGVDRVGAGDDKFSLTTSHGMVLARYRSK